MNRSDWEMVMIPGHDQHSPAMTTGTARKDKLFHQYCSMAPLASAMSLAR